MMRGLLASLVLCNFAFMQVELYVITVDSFITSASDSPITVEEINMTDYDSDFKYNDVYEYAVTFNTANEDDGNIPLEYLYIDNNDNVVDKGNTSLCSADLSTTAGTVAAIVAMALGIKSDPVCPLQESTMSQKSVFIIEGGDFSNLPNSEDENDILSVSLEVYSSSYMAIKLSITDEDFWFDDDAVDPDEENSDGESQDENESSSSEQSEE